VKAHDHTRCMLAWWTWAGVTHADLMVRRRDGAIIWHDGVALDGVYLDWLGYENAAGSEIYIRPAREGAWPVVFLDDVEVARATRIVDKYSALAIRTSKVGGAHIWLRATIALDERQRRHAQQFLAPLAKADLGSTSGEHLGRLAGFRNWKRQGEWTGVVTASRSPPAWDPSPALAASERITPSTQSAGRRSGSAHDRSASGRDWGWVCSQLEAGVDPAGVRLELERRAAQRRGRDAARYASRTVNAAAARLAGG